MCECADPACAHRVDASLAEYEEVRGDGTQFLVVPGHEEPAIEEVVEERPRFTIVAKVRGVLGSTARQLDPRTGEA